MLLIINDIITDFFKSIASWLGYGLLGLAAVIIIVTAYLILKKPDKRGIILMFMIFCAFILMFFTWAGIGIVGENNNLKIQTDTLSSNNKFLKLKNDTIGKFINDTSKIKAWINYKRDTSNIKANILGEKLINIIGSQDCPKTGDAMDAKRKETNVKKNRDANPSASDIDASVTIFKMLNSQDDENAFDENKAGMITGYLLKAKDEGPESCNCHSDNPVNHDIHIFIAPNKNSNNAAECVVVEITPWVKRQHPDWTSEYLNSIKGHKIQITGWLFDDWEHKMQSFASNPDLNHPARGTVWELHPISNIEDLK